MIRTRNIQHQNVIHVLALDGGGMRGLYTASVLETLARRFSDHDGNDQGLDIGEAFDLIVGTSTGAILAAAIAYGASLSQIKELYCRHGSEIFADPMPPYDRSHRVTLKARFIYWCLKHRSKPGADGVVLKHALQDIFGDATLGDLYARRNVGLCITATSLHNHHPRVFKTCHLGSKYRRDERLRLVDVCMASAAAPVYLPLAEVNGAVDSERHVFADGGLWANNPVVIALTEALAMSDPDQSIRIFSVGTCSPPVGGTPENLHRGLLDWKAGIGALELSMNSQAAAAHYQAKHLVAQLSRHGKDIRLYRCPESAPSREMAQHIGLDKAGPQAIDALIRHGAEDGNNAFKEFQAGTPDGKLIQAMFSRMSRVN